MNEIIYILINEAMPGYVKIGKTSTSLEQRVRELSGSTSVPLPFTCFYACTVNNASFVEHQLHDAFDNSRVNPRREFFQISPERVVAALKLAEIENITPKKDFVVTEEDQKALNEARTRRSVFSFKMVNIPIGAELIFSRDENVDYFIHIFLFQKFIAWHTKGFRNIGNGRKCWVLVTTFNIAHICSIQLKSAT